MQCVALSEMLDPVRLISTAAEDLQTKIAGYANKTFIDINFMFSGDHKFLITIKLLITAISKLCVKKYDQMWGEDTGVERFVNLLDNSS